MSIVVPVISANQGGQAAITFYDLSKAKAKQGAPLVQAALTPTLPSIVQPPVFSLPVKLTPGLPSMTPIDQNPPGTGMTCAMKAAQEEAEAGDWMCRLGRWVDDNPLMALGAVALVYVVANGKGKR